MAQPRHLLLFRFSSLGDVAMTVPVIQLLLQQYPHLQVTMVSTAFVKPLFNNIERLHFIAADIKGAHKGFWGLYKMAKALQRQVPFDAVADLHNVLRTKVLRGFFIFTGRQIAVIDKGRKEKKQLTRKENKVMVPLKSTFQRYADVFAALGLPVQLQVANGVKATQPVASWEALKREGHYLVGIAPFAQYERKMYPLDKMKMVLNMLVQHPNVKLFLFGGGQKETAILNEWAAALPQTECMAGKMSFAEELHYISNLDVMVSMDSANMHLASLYGVPVVSVWGATHPYAGFYGWGQQPDNAVQVDLWCRPCSVFGNKKGYRDDLPCLHMIAPVTIYQKIMTQLESRNS